MYIQGPKRDKDKEICKRIYGRYQGYVGRCSERAKKKTWNYLGTYEGSWRKYPAERMDRW